MVRDTVEVGPNGFIVLRFKADNPGCGFSIVMLIGI